MTIQASYKFYSEKVLCMAMNENLHFSHEIIKKYNCKSKITKCIYLEWEHNSRLGFGLEV